MKKFINYVICMIAILALVICISTCFGLKKSKRDTTRGEKIITKETIIGADKERENTTQNKYIQVESYIEKDEVLYKYTIYNAQREKIYEDSGLYKEPNINELTDGIISVGISAGTDLYMVQYYDKFNARISDVFTNPYDLKHNKVICFEKKKLVIQDIFSKSVYYKEIQLNIPDVADPNSAIKCAKFVDDDIVKVTYLVGNNYKEVTDTFDLNQY